MRKYYLTSWNKTKHWALNQQLDYLLLFSAQLLMHTLKGNPAVTQPLSAFGSTLNATLAKMFGSHFIHVLRMFFYVCHFRLSIVAS